MTASAAQALDDAAIAGLEETDLAHLIHPQYYAPDHAHPVIYDRGEGVWLTDVRGRRYIDALASLWNVAAGHGRGELAEAAAEQMRKAAFVNNYTGYSNAPAIELAGRLAEELAYDNLEGVFFTNSGSESNEGAFKAARFYWSLRGRPEKVKLIARERAYHGGTLFATAMTGLAPFWKHFGPLSPEVVRATAPERTCGCAPNSDGECACWLEAAIAREGADTVAAFIAEPVKGAGGVWTPSDEYFPKVRELCDRHEVALHRRRGDHRLRAHRALVRPRALGRAAGHPDDVEGDHVRATSRSAASSSAARSWAALRELPPDARFMHAYTNSAHPTACAVALRNLRIIEDEDLVGNARAMGERLGGGLRAELGGHPHVANIRQLGLMAGPLARARRRHRRALRSLRGRRRPGGEAHARGGGGDHPLRRRRAGLRAAARRLRGRGRPDRRRHPQGPCGR